MTRTDRPKVFCVGFQKTGTTSLNKALEMLGYRVHSVYRSGTDVETIEARLIEDGLRLAAAYDAVEDMPWPLIFRELDQAFPGSRFILTWRETDRWLASITNHFGTAPDPMQELTYGRNHPYPKGHEARYAAVYEAHNAAVRAHFAARPGDLLEMNLSKGDGWDALCGFLGHDVPEGPFPRANTVAVRRSFGYRLRRRLRMLGLPVVVR